ncbi:MAG: hypothetical protein Kow0099_15640 [Candidatus Abyssubacteria bacterium]
MKNQDTPIHVLWLPTVVAAGIAYIISWIDLVPGIGVGWLDDIAVFIALVWFFTSWLPRNKHRIYWFRPAQGGSQGRSHATHKSGNGGVEFNPFEELDIRPDASQEEIRQAYRRILSKYHPDKVTHLGAEFQQMAHEKVIRIQKAYEILCGKE